jgi:hypothetical protein
MVDADGATTPGGDGGEVPARSGNFYRLPLAEDTTGRSTLMRVEPSHGGQVLLHLHDCADERAFAVRLG